MENEVRETNTRTRMAISLTAKGFAQWDVTCEYDTPEKSAEMMRAAIDMVRSVIAEKGLKECGAE